MADFTIIESQRSVPGAGPNVYGQLPTDTGAGMMAQAVGGFGGALADLGMSLYVAQGQAELTQRMAEANQAVQEMHLAFEKEPDPQRYDELWQDTWQKISSAEIRNGWAARRYRMALPQLKVAQEAALKRAAEERIRDNHEMAVATQEAQFIKTGNPGGLDALYQDEVENKWLSPEEAKYKFEIAKEKAEAKKHADTQQAMSAWTYVNPEAVLAWENAEQMKVVFPDAIPTDLTWIQGVARNVVSMREQRQSQLETAEIEDIHAKASQGVDPAEMARLILSKENLSPTQKSALMKEYNSALSIWYKTKQNPYTVRQDHTRFNEMLNEAIDGNLTEKQIRPEIGKTITINDAQTLRNVLANGPDAANFEDSSAAKFLRELIEDWGRTRLAAMPEQVPMIREKGYRILDELIDKAEPPLTNRQKKEEALRIFYDLIADQRIIGPAAIMTEEEKARFEAEMIETQAIRQPEGTPAGDWGVHDGKGNVVLNETGVRALLSQIKGDTVEERIAAARKLAAKRGWIIPK